MHRFHKGKFSGHASVLKKDYLNSKDYLQDLLDHTFLQIYFSNQQVDQPHKQNYLRISVSEY